jgi:hypothetical protein
VIFHSWPFNNEIPSAPITFALSSDTECYYDFSSFSLGVRVVAGSNPAAPTNPKLQYRTNEAHGRYQRSRRDETGKHRVPVPLLRIVQATGLGGVWAARERNYASTSRFRFRPANNDLVFSNRSGTPKLSLNRIDAVRASQTAANPRQG